MKNKHRERAAGRVKRGRVAKSGRGTITNRPPHPVDEDRRQRIPAHPDRDPRWDELVATLRSRFPACEDSDIWKKLRSHFESGVLSHELIRSLRMVRPDDFLGTRMPRNLPELAERAEELKDGSLAYLAERLEDLLVVHDRIEHDAARALAGFAGALRWAEHRPDVTRAMLCDIEDEPALSSTAAWPRVAFLLWLQGPEAFDRFPDEAAWLTSLARVELAGRPRLAPAWLYPMLGMGPEDGVFRESEEQATAIRDAVEMAADQFVDLMFAPGPAMPAWRHAGQHGAPASAGANGRTASE